MNKPHDYIPRPDADFDVWQKNFIKKIIPLASSLGIPKSEINLLKSKKKIWTQNYSKGGKHNKTTRNSAETRAKTDARIDYEKSLRYFVKRWVSYNNLVLTELKVALGVRVPDKTRTRKPKPVSKPVCTKKNNTEHLEIEIEVRDENSPLSRKIPDDYKGYEVWGMLISDREVIPSPLPLNKFKYYGSSTKYNFIFKDFLETDTVSTLFFRMRWKNTYGETGPWSDVYSSLLI